MVLVRAILFSETQFPFLWNEDCQYWFVSLVIRIHANVVYLWDPIKNHLKAEHSLLNSHPLDFWDFSDVRRPCSAFTEGNLVTWNYTPQLPKSASESSVWCSCVLHRSDLKYIVWLLSCSLFIYQDTLWILSKEFLLLCYSLTSTCLIVLQSVNFPFWHLFLSGF